MVIWVMGWQKVKDHYGSTKYICPKCSSEEHMAGFCMICHFSDQQAQLDYHIDQKIDLEKTIAKHGEEYGSKWKREFLGFLFEHKREIERLEGEVKFDRDMKNPWSLENLKINLNVCMSMGCFFGIFLLILFILSGGLPGCFIVF